MKIALPSEVIQPAGGLVVEAPQERDYFLGGFTKLAGDILVPDGHWRDWLVGHESQINKYGNTFGCVSFSRNNCHEFLHKRQFNEEINMCDRYLVVGSGTVPNQGNSKRAVAEWGRKNGWVEEWRWSYPENMTLDEYYNGGKVPQELLTLGLQKLKKYEFGYQWLNGNSPPMLRQGLQLSPLQVDVEPYQFNSKGYVINTNRGYIHEVLLFDYEENECWWIFDSQSQQIVKFDWLYNFNSPMIHSLKKKSMKFKKLGRGIYVLGHDGYYHGVGSGKVFKALWGEYKDNQIDVVESLPPESISYTIGELTQGWSEEELSEVNF